MFKEVYEKIEVGFSPSEDAKCAAENKTKKKAFLSVDYCVIAESE